MVNRRGILNTKRKEYLDEKELFILYSLMRNKYISTWDDVFYHKNKSFIIPRNGSIQRTNEELIEIIKKIQSKKKSAVILDYLIELGEKLDPKGYSIYCNADYSLVEGGFLTEEKNGKTVAIKEYQEAIINKKADKDFIELVNKLITPYDGGKWETKDAEKFLSIYRRHNKEEFNKEINRVNKVIPNIFLRDDQTKLSELIFEHANIVLGIKNVKNLQDYLSEYIALFRKDELNGFSKNGLSGNFFAESTLAVPLHTKLFGYKKQKDILIQHINNIYEEYQRNDLEIGSPYFKPIYIADEKDNEKNFIISEVNNENELFLFVHTMLGFEQENVLEIKDCLYGTKDMFDLYERGFLFQILFKKETKEVIKLDKNDERKIKEIIFIKKKTQPKASYQFYLNGDIQDTKLLRNDSAKLRKFIEIVEGNDVEFNKDLLDYINSNSNCAIYNRGQYQLTKILERNGNYLRVCYGIKTKVISEIEYRKKINKKNEA